MKYTKVYDDRSLFGEPLTRERLIEDGYSEKEADELLEKIMLKKNILNEMEILGVKGIKSDGSVEEFLKKKSLKVRIPEDLFDELKNIEDKSHTDIDIVAEMLMRAGLSLWEEKRKKLGIE